CYLCLLVRSARQKRKDRRGAILNTPSPHPAPRAEPEYVGRVISVSGSQSEIGLTAGSRATDREQTTVGRFMGLMSGGGIIVRLATEISEQAGGPGAQQYRSVAAIDLIGEIRAGDKGGAIFQRGVADYPNMGDPAIMLTERELRLVYGAADINHAHI